MTDSISIETTASHPFVWPPTVENLAKLGLADMKYLVLYFYPKDDTPGCTLETIAFNALSAQFAKNQTAVLGISRDGVTCHDKFLKKHDVSLILIADTESTLCNTFEVIKEKMNYGKKYFGIERSTFIVDPKGNILAKWSKVKAAGHAELVLEKIKLM